MRLFSALLVAATVVACSDSSQPLPPSGGSLALLTEPGRTYVLGAVENQTAEPLVTFDHVCAGVRYRHTVRDTIEFLPGGAVRRAFVLEHWTDGAVRSSSYLTARGSWEVSGSTITLGLAPENYTAPVYTMRVSGRGAAAITSSSGLGGSCPGSPNDGRSAEFVYTLR